jgi:hypothetical protein
VVACSGNRSGPRDRRPDSLAPRAIGTRSQARGETVEQTVEPEGEAGVAVGAEHARGGREDIREAVGRQHRDVLAGPGDVGIAVVVTVAIAGTLAIVPESRSAEPAPLDIPGALLSVGALVTLVCGVIEAPANGWAAPGELLAFGASLGLGAAFVARELVTRAPLLDVRLLARPAFGSAVLAVLLTSFGLFGSMFSFSQYLQGVLGFGTMQTGVSVLPLAIAMAIGSPAGTPLATRIGTRITVAVGMTAVAAGLLVFRMAGTGDGYPFAAATLALVGLGMGMAMGPLTVLMVRTLPRSKQGVASAINSTARELGGALGVAILGSLAAPVYAAGVRPAATLLPPAAASAVGDSLAGAGAVAATLPGPQASALLGLARSAFVEGMSSAVLVGAVVAIVGAGVALALLPRRGEFMVAAAAVAEAHGAASDAVAPSGGLPSAELGAAA